MALSPRELEDDIIIAHNEIRRNPNILIHELENVIDTKGAYYTPSTHLATLIGDRDLEDIVSKLRQIQHLLYPNFKSVFS